MKERKIQSACEGWAELKRIIFPPWWRYYFSIRSQLRSADLGSMRRSSAVIIFHDRTGGPDQQNLKKKKPVRAKLRRWCRLSEASFQLRLLTHVVLSGQAILATLQPPTANIVPTSTGVASAYLILHFKFRLLLSLGYKD